MDIEFNADEAFVLAEQVEKKAADFYRRAALGSLAAPITALFAKLAAMEDDHAHVFAAMRSHPGFGGGPAHADIATGIWPMLANSMIDDMDQAMSKFFEKRDTAEDVLHAAMKFERDTIVLFLTLREMLDSPPEKDRMDQLVKEEMGHLISLGSQLATM